MPAPDVAVGDILEVTVYCTAGNQVAINVLHYYVAAIGGAVPQYDDLPDRAYVHYETPYRNWLSEDANFAGVGVRRMAPDAKTIEYTSIDIVPGNGDATCLPLQVAGLVTFRSDTPGPSGRGRAYIPFPPASSLEGAGAMVAGYKTLLEAVADAIGPSISWTAVASAWTVTLQQIVAPRIPSIYIEVSAPTGLWATQRRRGDYGRPNSLPISY